MLLLYGTTEEPKKEVDAQLSLSHTSKIVGFYFYSSHLPFAPDASSSPVSEAQGLGFVRICICLDDNDHARSVGVGKTLLPLLHVFCCAPVNLCSCSYIQVFAWWARKRQRFKPYFPILANHSPKMAKVSVLLHLVETNVYLSTNDHPEVPNHNPGFPLVSTAYGFYRTPFHLNVRLGLPSGQGDVSLHIAATASRCARGLSPRSKQEQNGSSPCRSPSFWLEDMR